MRHACGFCKATFSFLILQFNPDKDVYELRCQQHTEREWPTVAAVDKQKTPGVALGRVVKA